MKAELLIIGAIALGVQAQAKTSSITVQNSLAEPRSGEIVEIPAESILSGYPDGFVITDAAGTEVPYQLTHDGLIVMPVNVGPSSCAVYGVRAGKPAPVDTVVRGRYYPERKDDFAWENQRAAYRAYGPELERSGERAFGYDLWTKNVPGLVVEHRYVENNSGRHSFHKDDGTGMDVYNVGPTLGGGATALFDDEGQLILPWAFASHEVLDNGPLRMTVRLTYKPKAVGADSAVVETRVVTLDSNSPLNRTWVSFSGLTSDRALAPGIVVHEASPDAYVFNEAESWMAYDDPTDNVNNNNGRIYIGVLVPEGSVFSYRPLAAKAGDAVGHILAEYVYQPGADDDPTSEPTEYVYYWGSDWSKGATPDFSAWQATMSSFARRLATPLVVTLD